MSYNIIYKKIHPCDYETLTRIMTLAFDEDTAIHTDETEGGPNGYNDGSLIKGLNEHVDFESYKIIYDDIVVGAYTVGLKKNKVYSLEMLFIDSSYREKHLGTIVWKDIEQKYIDAKKWMVETPDYSTRNHHFYTKKCGFVFLKENRHENGCKSFLFEKTI
jgi:hypothetical protein